MDKNAYFGTDTGNFGTGTAMYAVSIGCLLNITWIYLYFIFFFYFWTSKVSEQLF